FTHVSLSASARSSESFSNCGPRPVAWFPTLIAYTVDQASGRVAESRVTTPERQNVSIALTWWNQRAAQAGATTGEYVCRLRLSRGVRSSRTRSRSNRFESPGWSAPDAPGAGCTQRRGARTATIGDVAAVAGVSRSPASYALSGRRSIS